MSVSFGILSTYPPTQCGMASFSNSLLEALRSDHDGVGVVAVVDTMSPAPHPDVAHQWVRGLPTGAPPRRRPGQLRRRGHPARVRHLPGIGRHRRPRRGPRAVEVPVDLVLHTVLSHPERRGNGSSWKNSSLRQRRRRDDDAHRRDRLVEHYTVDPATIHVIPHGAVDNRPPATCRIRRRGGRRARSTPPVILTWGLLGEGKGIEWAIEAMALLQDLHPRPRYHVVGQTHPRVLRAARRAVSRRADRAGGRPRRLRLRALRRPLPSPRRNSTHWSRLPTSSCCRTTRSSR